MIGAPSEASIVNQQFIMKVAAAAFDAVTELSPHRAREIKAKYSFVHDIDEKALVMLDVKTDPTEQTTPCHLASTFAVMQVKRVH